MAVHYRTATKKDVPTLFWFIQQLAENLRESDDLEINQEDLIRDGFDQDCYFKFILAELDSDPPESSHVTIPNAAELPSVSLPPSASMEKNERLVGYALYYTAYSTMKGKALHLEDLFIREEYRDQGYGAALIKECAKVAKERECNMMDWQVHDWNDKAMRFYKRLGGVWMKELQTIHMNKANLLQLSSSLS